MVSILLLDNYMHPPIPNGYRYVRGNWDKDFTIERIRDKSILTWIPVGFLDANGTWDGVNFNEKFGRRNWLNDDFSFESFHDEKTNELEEQKISTEIWGGFYITSFNISKSIIGKPHSRKGEKPCCNLKFEKFKRIAGSFENGSMIKSHLPYGAEMDCVNEWFIKSGGRTYTEMTKLSTPMGNHWNSKNPPRCVMKTGSREEWCTNSIYDWTGNVCELTQERYGDSAHVIRGASYCNYGSEYTAVYRDICLDFRYFNYVGIRIAITISPEAECTFI